MNKREIKTASTNKLIVELVLDTAKLCVNQNSGRATKTLSAHVNDVQDELRKRDVLEAEDIERLNA